MTSKQKVELMREGQHVRVTHKFIKDCLELLSSAEYASMQILVGYAYLEVIEKPETSSEKINVAGEGSMINRLDKMENEINEIIAKFDVEMIKVEAEENKPETFAIIANGEIIADGITSRSYTERIVSELKRVRKKVVGEKMDLSEALDYANTYYSGTVQRECLVNSFVVRIGHYNEFGHVYKEIKESQANELERVKKEAKEIIEEEYGYGMYEVVEIKEWEVVGERIEDSAFYSEDGRISVEIILEKDKDLECDNPNAFYVIDMERDGELIGYFKLKRK